MSQERSSSSPYTVLPSIFDSSLAAKKGASFGYGNRGFMNTSANPGPGAYELSQKMVKKCKIINAFLLIFLIKMV